MYQIQVAPIRIAVSNGTTYELDEIAYQHIVTFEGDEAEVDKRLDDASVDRTNKDVNILINDDPDKEITPKLSRQVANVESIFIG